MEPCPSMPSVPNHGFNPTSIRQPTQIAIFFRVFRGPIHRRNPIPLNPCPSVFIRGEKTPRPLPSFRVIRVCRDSIQHHIKSVAIRGYPTPFSKHNNRTGSDGTSPSRKNLTLIPCRPWFPKPPETVLKMRIFRISRSGHPQQPRNLFRSGRFRTAKTSVFARAILEQLAQPG